LGDVAMNLKAFSNESFVYCLGVARGEEMALQLIRTAQGKEIDLVALKN